MAFTTSLTDSAAYPVVTLKDETTGCEAEIYAFGGFLNAFRIPFNGSVQNVVDGYSNVADAIQNISYRFKGAKLSPFVCRLNNATYRFGGSDYKIQTHILDEHAIHGLVYDEPFRVARREEFVSYASVTLVYEYPGNEPGYPFPYDIAITWMLETGNRLSVSTTITNQAQQPVPLADGWHPYFKLNGLLDNWTLQFSHSSQLEYEALIPTGKKIADTRFLEGCSLQDLELDNGFEWTFPDDKNQCILSDGSLRLLIEPDTNHPILQVYISPERKSIAIENLSGAPDNFNNGMNLIFLPPGHSKTFAITYSADVL